jgi:hypothetical protein
LLLSLLLSLLMTLRAAADAGAGSLASFHTIGAIH